MFRLVGLALLAMLVVSNVVPAELRPVTGAPSFAEHFAAFLLTGGVLERSFPDRPVRLGGALILFSAAIEIAQLFVPGRHARFSDFAVDAVGAILGMLLSMTLARSLSRSKS